VANIYVAASATWNGKALKKAKKDVNAFDQQIKNFAKTFGAAFSARAIMRFSKSAVTAFANDQKAAKALEQQLKNTGYAFATAPIERYIANLQNTTGVVDDQLRPAFQQLLTVTGSITKSQEALNTALNVSAATGKSLTEVTAALAKGFAGQTTGLSRLNAGLTKATLKTGDMDKILGELNNKFGGQAQARLTTYAGKIDLLTVRAETAKEIIGEGIVDALTTLADDKTIDNLATSMEDFATATADTARGIAVIIDKLKSIPGVNKLFTLEAIPVVGAYLGGFREIGARSRNQVDRGGQERTMGRILKAQRIQEIRASKDLVSLKKQEITTLKEKSAVDKLRDQFDIERIGYTKALNEATDAETKLRLQAKIAILDNNEALAKKILEELAAANAAKKLAEDALAAAKALAALGTFDPSRFRRGEEASMLTLLPLLAGLGGLAGGKGGASAANEITGTLGGSIFDPSFARRGEERSMAGLEITVNTQATGDRFAQLIAESLQVAQKSGVSYGIAGGL
jgi:hypothetical protein